MTRTTVVAIGMFAATLMALPGTVSAQTPPGNSWSHGTTLDLFGGAVTAPSADTRGTLGGSLGWEINHHLQIEGAGAWVIARQDDRAFSAELKAIVNLTSPNTAVPFVGAGVGMYIATFDSASTSIPAFYKTRLAGSLAGATQSFTDPSLVLAGGISFLSTAHFSIRPEVSVRWVLNGSDSYAVTMAVVHAIYHFEEHGKGDQRTR